MYTFVEWLKEQQSVLPPSTGEKSDRMKGCCAVGPPGGPGQSEVFRCSALDPMEWHSHFYQMTLAFVFFVAPVLQLLMQTLSRDEKGNQKAATKAMRTWQLWRSEQRHPHAARCVEGTALGATAIWSVPECAAGAVLDKQSCLLGQWGTTGRPPALEQA